MRTRRIGWRYGWASVGAVVVLAAAALVLVRPSWRRPDRFAERARTPVRRTNLNVTMTAGGRVESSSKTVVECELEALDVGAMGTRVATGGASTILSVIPDGSRVKKGDVLAVLDASDYEDLLTAQQMNVDRAHADRLEAVLNLEVARLALEEYREGLMAQTLKTLEGTIAMARADVERAADRLRWSRRMLQKGYVARATITTQEFEAARLALALWKSQTELRLFQRYSAPMYLKILDSDIKAAEAMLSYQNLRADAQETRLDALQSQIERCTIRAPRDGFVIHANDPRKAILIEPGITVRQRQRLFYLPDLARMEVATLLHESVAREVKPGMRARVKIEALSGRELEGHVTAISQLPATVQWNSQVQFFTAAVVLDSIPEGLRPGMTAEVEIVTRLKPDVLAIPAEALAVEEGRDVCYVAHDDHLERREVKLGESTRDLLEVTEGLGEGEEVVLDPTRLPDPTDASALADHAPAEAD